MRKARELENATDTIIEQWDQGSDRAAAFHKLFEIYYRPVYRFFEKRGFSHDDSHDLTQETFIRVYNGMESFRREAPFDAWLFQIAANVYRNALRHRSAQKRAGFHLALVDAGDNQAAEAVEIADRSQSDPLDAVLQDEKLRVLREAIESLPDQMRKCVMLRVYQELGYQEIAILMRISVETVKAHLYQARQQLKSKVAIYFDVPEF